MLPTVRFGFAALVVFLGSCVVESLAPCSSDEECKRYGAGLFCLLPSQTGARGWCARPDGGLGDASLDGAPDGAVASCASAQDCIDPSRPFCDVQLMTCRGCTRADCAGQHLACGASGACAACVLHADCETGVCAAGACADAGDVAYVSNVPTVCSDAPHASTQATPYCQIQTAITVSGKPNVVVYGNASAYGALSIAATTADASVTLIGPGRAASPTATIQQPAGTALSVTSSSGRTATVVVDGLDLNGAVLCSAMGAANLTLKGSAIHGATQIGVDSSGCGLTLDANLVLSNQAGGVRVMGGAYTMTNNIIALNGAGLSPGVTLGFQSSGTFAFNTVAQNQVSAGAGGIFCQASALIANSIVWGNHQAAGTQFAGSCTLQRVVTGASDNATAGTRLDPAFLSGTDFHLDVSGAKLAVNSACCVDQLATPPGTPNQEHDVDLSPRPKSQKWDLGAHEAH